MPSDDSSEINHEVRSSTPSFIPKIPILNPQFEEPGRRYPLRERKAPDRLGFTKSSSNIAYPISDFVSYHRLSRTNLSFALQLSSVPIPSYFQEAFENSKWKLAMTEEMKAL